MVNRYIHDKLESLKLFCYRFNRVNNTFYKDEFCDVEGGEGHDLNVIASFLNDEHIAYSVDENLNIILYFDDAQDVFVVKLDRNANIVYFNDYASWLTGYAKESVIGENWFDLFIESVDLVEAKGAFDSVLNNALYQANHQNVIRCKDGTCKNLVWKNSLRKDNSGDNDIVLFIGLIS